VGPLYFTIIHITTKQSFENCEILQPNPQALAVNGFKFSKTIPFHCCA